MAMNPRLLRPRASGDPDALRYIAAVQSADGQSLEAGVAKAISNFVVGCKLDGIWSSIKASCILCGARTLAGALTPLAGTAPTNVNFVSGDYDRKTGLLGNGSTKYLNSNRSTSADPQNSHHVAAYVSTAQTSGGGGSSNLYPTYIGNYDANGGCTQFGRFPSNSTTVFVRSRSLTFLTFADYASHTGLIGVNRDNASTVVVRSNGSTTAAQNLTSQAPINVNIAIFNTLFSTGASTENYSNGRLAFYSIGEALTLSLLDSRVATLVTAIGAAI